MASEGAAKEPNGFQSKWCTHKNLRDNDGSKSVPSDFER